MVHFFRHSVGMATAKRYELSERVFSATKHKRYHTHIPFFSFVWMAVGGMGGARQG